VAAHLVQGLPLTELGPAVDDPVSWPDPQPQRLPDGRLRAEVVYVDHFGNLVTNVRLAEWESTDLRDVRIVVAGVSVAAHRTYADVEKGTLLALVGSDGYLELAVREGSAAERLGLGIGATLTVRGM
jgi:S-adenosylmethionine hydrolase